MLYPLMHCFTMTCLPSPGKVFLMVSPPIAPKSSLLTRRKSAAVEPVFPPAIYAVDSDRTRQTHFQTSQHVVPHETRLPTIELQNARTRSMLACTSDIHPAHQVVSKGIQWQSCGFCRWPYRRAGACSSSGV